MKSVPSTTLLGASDPEPVEVLHFDSDMPLLLLCEHAGRAVPAMLGNLGVSQEVLASHRGWDIGAGDVARRLACLLNAPLVLQGYSRLVIDANRPPGSPSSVPSVSDGEAIPGNQGLTAEHVEARVAEIFKPMDMAVVRGFSACPRRVAFSIHSFTPRLSGVDRPWHAGFVSRRSVSTAERIRASIARAASDLTLAINEPYQIEDETDWFIPVHAETRGLPHCMIEIRNDGIDHPEGIAFWSELLAAAIRQIMGDLTFH